MNTTCPWAGRFWANVLYDINMRLRKLFQKILLMAGFTAALLLSPQATTAKEAAIR
jgi:hypothetical protein